ncbi:hypothetical protein A0H81_03534 [Grifola frondosa]|uniref:MYND-type domain-containing protein n=1 Tax=Grifola frondosa TaxID=5627 RepID=A0A1C7MI63_GRIFR|nr:hypothetical protein A0H81_03534 [Grifola frondosa]
MNKRMGMEGMLGVGGGMISKEAQKNLEKAEDLCRKRRPEKALPYLEKAMEGGNNLDAIVQMAFLMPTMDMSVKLLEEAEEKGRAQLIRALGPKCFDDDGDCVEHFWGLLETRPYMRVLQALVRLAFETKDYSKSANTIIEMLRLCPGDNMGQRDWLGSVLMKAGRSVDALSFAQAWLQPETVKTGAPPKRGGCTFASPSKEPMRQERVDSLSEWGPAEIIYTGALSSFKLWGDCELARQYLKIGARLNPHILLKILAKVDQPRSLNNSPRALNSPESAQDYLWLTQDLWMAPDIWAWADSDAEAKSSVLRTCSRADCGKLEDKVAEFKRCGGCKEVVYCGPECQKQDWKEHKPRMSLPTPPFPHVPPNVFPLAECQAHKKQKEFLRMMRQGKQAPASGMDSAFFG